VLYMSSLSDLWGVLKQDHHTLHYVRGDTYSPEANR